MERSMADIDGIHTHDLRYGKLDKNRNVFLNKHEGDHIEVVLHGVKAHEGERVLLTLTGASDIETAWRVEKAQPSNEGEALFTRCVLKFEGTITD